jgi:hypothetical protein
MKKNTGVIDGAAADASADPRRLLEQSRVRYARGELREAWAACFAAAVSAYGIRWGLVFPRNATEYECLALVRSWGASAAIPRGEAAEAPAAANGGEDSQAVVQAFADLVQNSTALAYGGLFPGGGAFELALDFCQSLLPRGDNA